MNKPVYCLYCKSMVKNKTEDGKTNFFCSNSCLTICKASPYFMQTSKSYKNLVSNKICNFCYSDILPNTVTFHCNDTIYCSFNCRFKDSGVT